MIETTYIIEKKKQFSSMIIKIPTKLNCKVTIELMLIFVCIERFLESFGFPHLIIFLLDFANIYLLINLLINSKTQRSIKNPIIITQIIIVSVGIAVALFSGVKPLLILWAIRNLCRFWIFYCACIVFLRGNDVLEIFNIFKILYVINLLFFVVQYILGFRGDHLGGIFGNAVGANSYCNIFLAIVCTYELACWFNKKESTSKMLFVTLTSVLISAVAEIKFFFVELACILTLVFIIDCFIKGNTKFIIRAIMAAVIIGTMLLIGIVILGRLYPNFANFFTIDQLLYHSTRTSGYSGSGDLNRLTAIGTINSKVFSGLSVNKFFGMGLGSTEYSSWNIMTSGFYNQYSYLHYYWFLHAWMYLENGYLGLILYPAGFAINGLMGIYQLKKHKNNGAPSSIIITGTILSFIVLGIYLYNQSMRIECAYLLYFCFAAMRVGVNSGYDGTGAIKSVRDNT